MLNEPLVQYLTTWMKGEAKIHSVIYKKGQKNQTNRSDNIGPVPELP